LPARSPLRIFHITPIPNLASIAESETLYAKSAMQKKKIDYADIAYQGAQGKRATKIVTKPPAGFIHDYVPFYFAPRSPMLRTINLGNVPGCPYRQADIVHLETTVEAIVEAKLAYVFYDYNATLNISTCYSDLNDLHRIDWDLFFETPRLDGYCAYWFSDINKPRYARRMETRQAEFLVYKSVPLNLMNVVGVYSPEKAAEVQEIFDDAKIKIPVEVKTAWYF
jgi:hypothetical protein